MTISRAANILNIIPTTTIGGYGHIHENVHVKANGIIAPGYASLMEEDCKTGTGQGKLTIHNLYMEKDAVMRISVAYRPGNCEQDPITGAWNVNCTQTDTLEVMDSIFFRGKIPLYILPETEYLEPGCYLFMEYYDTGASAEYINNLELRTLTHGPYFFGLDKSERGRVYLCISTTSPFPQPDIKRYIDLPLVEGVTTNPGPGKHFASGHHDFTFTVNFNYRAPMTVGAVGYYSQTTVNLDSASRQIGENEFEYTIRQVVQPWTVFIGPALRPGDVSNEMFAGRKVWAYRNTLYINVEKEDVVSIYSMVGVLYRKVEIPAGLNNFTLEKGVHVVTLKDGTVHRIIIH